MSLISPAVVHIVRMTQITINIMWVEYEILKFFLKSNSAKEDFRGNTVMLQSKTTHLLHSYQGFSHFTCLCPRSSSTPSLPSILIPLRVTLYSSFFCLESFY